MLVDASEKRMRRDGCFKLAAVRFNRMQLGFTHCCLLFELSLAWNCRMRFLFYSLCRDRSCRLILSGRPTSHASSFTSTENCRGSVKIRLRIRSHLNTKNPNDPIGSLTEKQTTNGDSKITSTRIAAVLIED